MKCKYCGAPMRLCCTRWVCPNQKSEEKKASEKTRASIRAMLAEWSKDILSS